MFDMKYYYLEFTYPRIVFAIVYIISKSGGVMSARVATYWPRVHNVYFNYYIVFFFSKLRSVMRSI